MRKVYELLLVKAGHVNVSVLKSADLDYNIIQTVSISW